MSSRFSQTQGTQSLPPICRPRPILPPGWLPPSHPDIICYLEWEVKLYAGPIAKHKVIYVVHWAPANSWWFGGDASGPWYISTVIGPVTPGQAVDIVTSVDTVLAPVMIYQRTGPAYTSRQPWKADGLKIVFPGHPGYVWQGFRTGY